MKVKDLIKHITLTITEMQLKETIGNEAIFEGKVSDLREKKLFLDKTINSVNVKDNKLILFVK